MIPQAGPGSSNSTADFNTLREYLRGELERQAADQRAITLATQESFAKWAHTVLEHVATALGVAIGYLVGLATGAYESVKEGFGSGFKEGFRRGRGRND